MLEECWDLKELKEARSKRSNNNAINGLENESKNNVKSYDVLSTKLEELKGPAALVKINGKPTRALMDTGSEVSLVDGRVIAAATTEKCGARITAANSQLIPVQGVMRNSEVEFDGRKVGVDLIV